MSLTNILTVLSAILVVVEILVLVFTDQVVVGVLVALFIVGIVGGVLFWRWHTNQPIVTFLNHEKTLTFEDRDAHRATQVSKLRVRANHRGVQRLKMGTVRGDGPIKNILIDGQPPTHIEEVLGAKEVYKAFNPPLGYREERDIEATLL